MSPDHTQRNAPSLSCPCSPTRGWMLAAALLVLLPRALQAQEVAPPDPLIPGYVLFTQKISDTYGGFTGALDDDDAFGRAAASLGDLDGDGVSDLAVGAVGDNDGGPNRGAVWILFLRSNGTVKGHQKISDTQGGFTGTLDDADLFGGALTAPGDLDGDGITDLVVGASKDDDGGSAHGAVWVLFLHANGTVKGHQKISDTQGGFTGTLDIGDHFGNAVAALGDLDGDGVTDLAVGAFQDGDGGTDRGAVWILFLHPDGTVKSHQKISDTQGGFTGTLDDNDTFGTSVAPLGDLDRDGIPELAVGAEQDSDGGVLRGAAWVLFLYADGTVRSHQKINSTQGGFTGHLEQGDYFGSSVAAPGDLDGDGLADLVVGADGDDDGGSARGAVWVLFLDARGRVQYHQKISDTQGGFTGTLDNIDRFGASATVLGDLDGDGVTELAVGASLDDDGGPSRGAAYVLFLDGFVPAFTLTLKSTTINQNGKGVAKLKWDADAVATGKLDLHVDGSFFKRTTNDGKVKLKFADPNAGPFAIRACAKNSTTACSNTVLASFAGAPLEFETPDAYDDDEDAVAGRRAEAGLPARDAHAVPEAFVLQGSYPNPFNPTTTLRFDLPEAAAVAVAVYDVVGRQVLALPTRPVEAGAGRTLMLDAGRLASGVYVYRLVARAAEATYTASGRMTLAR